MAACLCAEKRVRSTVCACACSPLSSQFLFYRFPFIRLPLDFFLRGKRVAEHPGIHIFFFISAEINVAHSLAHTNGQARERRFRSRWRGLQVDQRISFYFVVSAYRPFDVYVPSALRLFPFSFSFGASVQCRIGWVFPFFLFPLSAYDASDVSLSFTASTRRCGCIRLHRPPWRALTPRARVTCFTCLPFFSLFIASPPSVLATASSFFFSRFLSFWGYFLCMPVCAHLFFFLGILFRLFKSRFFFGGVGSGGRGACSCRGR